MALTIKQRFIVSVRKRLPWLPARAVVPSAAALVLVPAITVFGFSYGPMVSVQPESGTRSGGASVVADTNASGGQSVKFNAQAGGGDDCPNAPHTPGGDDGEGGCWPYAGNTGVPSGVTLTPYTGPMTILTPNTVISGRTITGDMSIQATGVRIVNSVVNGHIDIDGGNRDLTIEDSIVSAGGVSNPAVGYNGLTIRRTEITGGQHSIACSGDCVIEDNWLHDQYNPEGGGYHTNAFISNGGANMVIRGNSLFCSPPNTSDNQGGCTANSSIFGDFAPMANVEFDRNLYMATEGGFCGVFGYNPGKTYGSNPTNITVTNNIFQRGPNNTCGVYGAVGSFLSANGNVWNNNRYADGVVIPPVN